MPINTVAQQPTTITLQLTDLLLAWQPAQSPSTRSMPISALNAYYALLTGASFTGNVSTTGTLTSGGAMTVQAGGLTVTGSQSTVNGALSVTGPLSGALTNYLSGMILSNDGSTPNTVLDISAGQCADSTNVTVIVLPAITKSTGGSWVAGSGANGMGQGLTIANSTWYHVFAILNGGNPDVYFDTSVTAANAPAGTTAFRRLGSFFTDSSAHILPFVQVADTFIWNSPGHDVNAFASSQTSTLKSLGSVPPGVKVDALIYAGGTNSAGTAGFLFSPPDQAAVAGAGLAFFSFFSPATSVAAWEQMQIRTDTSQNIRIVSSTNINNTVQVWTYGWVDRRGKA